MCPRGGGEPIPTAGGLCSNEADPEPKKKKIRSDNVIHALVHCIW